MRTLPATLQAHLDTRATTIAWCWKVTRSDATIMGFTNHDLAMAFDAMTFEAATGFSGSELEESLGLSVDNMEIEGALSAAAITEADLDAGLYDHALIELYLVNWADVEQRVLLKRGRIGEVVRGETGFQAEFRGLAADLQQPTGRLYQYGCDALLGDARCGVHLDDSAFTADCTVFAVQGRDVIETGDISAFALNWFAHGLLTFTSGANAGRAFEVKSSRPGSPQRITLWRKASAAIEAGDEFTIVAGCDKRFATCKAKFDNAVNFRGFPHMPEDEVIIRYPNKGDAGLDGGGNYNGAD